MSTTPNLEQIYSQYQAVVEQLQYLEGQIANVNSVSVELEGSKNTIKGIEKNKTDEEVIIPIGNMVSIKCKIVDQNEVLVNIGSGVVASQSFSEAVDIINKKIEEMSSYRETLLEEHKKLNDLAKNLQSALKQGQKK